MGWRWTHAPAAWPLATPCSVCVSSRDRGLIPGELRPPTSHFPGAENALGHPDEFDERRENVNIDGGRGVPVLSSSLYLMGIRQLINWGGAHQAEVPFVTS